MRARMRAELDRSDETRFDLKQGEGGLVDLEFLLQYLVLRDSRAHSELLIPRDTPSLIDAARVAGSLDLDVAQALHAAHGCLLKKGLSCTLDGRKRLFAPDRDIDIATRSVKGIFGACIGSVIDTTGCGSA